MCNTLYQTGATVVVKDGTFGHNSEESAHFEVQKPIYGDVTSNGVEAAVVPAVCEPPHANDAMGQEIFVFTLKGGAPSLLGELNDVTISNDYHRYYPTSNYHHVALGGKQGIRILEHTLVVTVIADGPVCCPKSRARLQYRWNGKRFVIIGKPSKSAYDWSAN
jgi:hypothetical protein